MKQRCRANYGTKDDILKFGGCKKIESKHGWGIKKIVLLNIQWTPHLNMSLQFNGTFILKVCFLS